MQTKPLIIQLIGQARSGKDYTASQLKKYFESAYKSVEILSYAAPMKRIAATLFDISLQQLDDFKNNTAYHTISIRSDYNKGPIQFIETDFRKILQLLGNEAMKSEFGDSVWADLMIKQIENSKSDIIIIPDCRFSVELYAIGGITIRVINEDLPPPMNHPSETELSHFQTDRVINNTGYRATFENIEQLGLEIISSLEQADKGTNI